MPMPTVAQHCVLRGLYAPATHEGRRLIAHDWHGAAVTSRATSQPAAGKTDATYERLVQRRVLRSEEQSLPGRGATERSRRREATHRANRSVCKETGKFVENTRMISTRFRTELKTALAISR
jgi:hypothetical protein